MTIDLQQAHEEIVAARQRFKKEKRLYEEAIHNYYKNVRKMDMERYRDYNSFSNDIERILNENNIPLSKVKKFNDKKVFEYLIANIDKFIKISPDKKELLKELKPNTVSKLSAIISALDNDYLFKQIVQNVRNINYTDPLTRNILKDSYGAIVYEDQIDDVIKLVLDTNEKEADMFYETLTHLSEIKNLDKIDGSILLMDYLRENHCELYSRPYKIQYHGFIYSAIEKGVNDIKATRLFNLLLAYFTNNKIKFKNTELHRTKQLYAKAYIELYCPNRLLDSVKEKIDSVHF